MPYTTVAQVGEASRARAASDDLHAAGFPASSISLVFPTRSVDHPLLTLPSPGDAVRGTGPHTPAEVAAGPPSSAASLLGESEWCATGPIQTILTGVDRRGTAHAMVRALVGLGLAEDEARHFAHELLVGHTLIAVRSDESACSLLVAEILRHHGGRDITQSIWPRTVHVSAPA